MPLDEDQRDDLLRIFGALRRSPEGRPDEEPAIIVGYGEDSWTLVGEAYLAFRRLAGQLASAALGGSGLSLKEAEDILVIACGRAFQGSADEAIEAVNARLDAPKRPYRVSRPFAAYYAGNRFQIGSSVISRGLPEEVRGVHEMLGEDFPALSLTVAVDARDQDTALLLADQDVGEITGILQLYDAEGVPLAGEAAVIIKEDGSWSATPATRRGLHLDWVVDGRGALHHYAAVLSDAQRTPYGHRTDWQRRCLNACRWLVTATSTPWPSLALVSLFVALEALFVEAGRHGTKKTIIADRMAERFSPPEQRDEYRQWLIDLYNRRNDAAHEALDYRDEMEVERLARRVTRATFWAAGHLMADHSLRGRTCTTIEDALACRS